MVVCIIIQIHTHIHTCIHTNMQTCQHTQRESEPDFPTFFLTHTCMPPPLGGYQLTALLSLQTSNTSTEIPDLVYHLPTIACSGTETLQGTKKKILPYQKIPDNNNIILIHNIHNVYSVGAISHD